MKIKEPCVINSDGSAVFVHPLDNKEYTYILPKDILTFIQVCNLSHFNIWYYGKYKSRKAEFRINAGSKDWGDVQFISFTSIPNYGIVDIKICAYFDYSIKHSILPITIEKLIHLLYIPPICFHFSWKIRKSLSFKKNC